MLDKIKDHEEDFDGGFSKFRRKPIFLITQNEGKETKNEATSLQNKCVQHPLWQALFSFNLASFSLFEYAHMPSLHNIYEPTKGKIIKNKIKIKI